MHVEEHTRITSSTATILDQFLTNIPELVQKVAVCAPVGTTDHSTVILTFRLTSDRSFTYKRQVWSYKQADFDGFRHALVTVDWDSCFQGNEDINVIYNTWCDLLLHTAKHFIF